MIYKLTQKDLKSLFSYNPDTGIFTYKIAVSNTIKIGQIAGTLHNLSYFRIKIDHKSYYSHCLAWLYMTGEWPTDQIDHINQEKGDNRFSNLRLCTQSQNMANTGIQKNNKSGYKGVSLRTNGKRWLANIMIDKKQRCLGQFKCKHDAAKAYNKKSLELFGDFAFQNEIKI